MVAGSDPTSFLNYEVFSDSGRSVVWENGTGVPYTGTGSAVPLTVYGSVAAAQTSAVSGSYSDTVTVAINY
jgi:spore coat protein U-like protein